MSSTRRFDFLGAGVRTKCPSKSICGSGSDKRLFVGRRSPKSTNFPVAIWPTDFSEISEKPGPTMNGWCRGNCGRTEARGSVDPAVAILAEGTTTGEGKGFEKVDTKEGTAGSLPCTEEAWTAEDRAKLTKPAPEVTNISA